jgi:hypothetical protein
MIVLGIEWHHNCPDGSRRWGDWTHYVRINPGSWPLKKLALRLWPFGEVPA